MLIVENSDIDIIESWLLDSLLLTLSVIPVIYFLLIRPLQTRIKENHMLQNEISELKIKHSEHKTNLH